MNAIKIIVRRGELLEFCVLSLDDKGDFIAGMFLTREDAVELWVKLEATLMEYQHDQNIYPK